METRKQAVQQALMRVFYAGALLILGWFFLASVFQIWNKNGTPPPRFFLAILAPLLLVAAYLARRFEGRITGKALACGAAAVLGLLLLAQLAVAWFLPVEPSWDFGAVYVSAREYVEGAGISTYRHYFERFQNNTGLLVWEIVLFKAIHALGAASPNAYLWAGMLLNILVIDAALLFALLFCRRVWGNGRAMLFLLLCLLFTPYAMYAPIFYTDSMSMLFVSLPLYLFSLYVEQAKPAARLGLGAAIGVLLAFGAKVKGSVAVLLAALALYALFNLPWKRLLGLLLAVLIPFGAFTAVFDWQVRRRGIIDPETAYVHQFPTEYWLYMGLKGDGSFNDDDFNYIYGFENAGQRREAARAGIAQRLRDYGVKGMADHLTKKAAFTFGDGSYFIGVQLQRMPLYEERAKSFSQKARPLYRAQDAYQALLLVCILLALAKGLLYAKGFDLPGLLAVALFGLCLFLMMWETRSRYLMNFTPVMLLLAAEGLDWAEGLFCRLLPTGKALAAPLEKILKKF